MQGKNDGCKEWPIEGESLFSYKGKPLPYMPFCYQHPDYWRTISEESKGTGNMIASRKLFDDSEAAHPITEEEFIKVENSPHQLAILTSWHWVRRSPCMVFLPLSGGVFRLSLVRGHRRVSHTDGHAVVKVRCWILQ